MPIQWTEELIKDSILQVVEAMGINYMPSRNEITRFVGNHALCNKISRTYGYYGWAKKLGLPIKSSDTTSGKAAEYYVAEVLENHGYKVKQMPQNYPYDLLVNDCAKIDVKFSRLYKYREEYAFYSFSLHKQYPTCDLYILIAEKDSKNRVMYVIPAKLVGQQQISIGEFTSKYAIYIDRLDYLDKYIKLHKSIA